MTDRNYRVITILNINGREYTFENRVHINDIPNNSELISHFGPIRSNLAVKSLLYIAMADMYADITGDESLKKEILKVHNKINKNGVSRV
jgi:hypothetical protein